MMTTIAMANTRGTELAMCNYPVVFFFLLEGSARNL